MPPESYAPTRVTMAGRCFRGNRSMTDLDRLQQLIGARHPCIAIGTVEEDYVLKMLVNVAVEAGREMLCWTVTRGVYDGLVSGQPPVPHTEHPAAALAHLCDRGPAGAAGVGVLGVVGHLKGGRAQRARREGSDAVSSRGGGMGLMDPGGELSAALAGVPAR